MIPLLLLAIVVPRPSLAQLGQVLGLFTEPSDESTPGVGCFFFEWRFGPYMQNITKPSHSYSPMDCQKQCQRTAGCEYFGYAKADKECWMADSSMHEVQLDSRFVSGPKQCVPVSPMCTETAGHGFPGATPAESNAAWSTGLVPPNLQCWPRTGDLSLSPCLGESIRTLDDAQEGWPGRCFGLKKVALAEETPAEVVRRCQTSCEVDAACAAWQAVSSDGGATAQCWMGMGYDCDRPRHDSAFQLVAAQRFMRGSYRVLMNLTGYEVVGLRRAFPANRFTRNELAVASCNHTCLSNIECELWTYSTTEGCRVSDPKFGRTNYPPTSGSFSKTVPAAASVIAGQYIQHQCEHPESPAQPLTPAPIVLTTPAVPTTYTTTSTTIPSTVTTTIPSTVTTTSTTTTHAPGTPEPAKADRFVRGETGQFTYFQDHETSTKHFVRASCDVCVPAAPCEDFVTVSDWYIENLPTGEDFECNMLSHQGALGSQEDMLQHHLKQEMHLPPPTPVTLDFVVQGLPYDLVDGVALGRFYDVVREEVAREADSPLKQVTLNVHPRGLSRNIGVKASVNVSRVPAPGQAAIQHVQSRLSSNSGDLARSLVDCLKAWVHEANVARDESEGPIGIPAVYTSIAGMEMLKGYAPTTTTTTGGSLTSSTSARPHGGEMVLSHAHNSLTVDHGGQGGSSSSAGWIVLVLFLLVLLMCSAIFVFDAKSRRKFKKLGRRGISAWRSHSFKSEDEEDPSEAQEGDEDEGQVSANDIDCGKPLMNRQKYRESPPGPIPTFGGMDLVTVTPQGLQVTPLGADLPPPGVPIMEPKRSSQGSQSRRPSGASLQQQVPQEGMDLVQITANGLSVTPWQGAPPPGVPMMDRFGMMQPGMTGMAPGTTMVDGRPMQYPMGMMPPSMHGGQVGTQMAVAPPPSDEYDLVTVTPTGLQVSSLDGNRTPNGLPVLDPARPPQPIGTMPSMPSLQMQNYATAALPTTTFR